MLKKAMDFIKSDAGIELIIYGIVGVLTTVVNVAIFQLFSNVLNVHYLISNVVAWVVAVIFAFVANKLWVFKSKSWQRELVQREAISFVIARLMSLGVDMLIMYLAVDILAVDELIAKIVANVFVIIINYVLSKLWIFKKKS